MIEQICINFGLGKYAPKKIWDIISCRYSKSFLYLIRVRRAEQYDNFISLPGRIKEYRHMPRRLFTSILKSFIHQEPWRGLWLFTAGMLIIKSITHQLSLYHILSFSLPSFDFYRSTDKYQCSVGVVLKIITRVTEPKITKNLF